MPATLSPAAIATLDVIEEGNLVANSRNMGQLLISALTDIASQVDRVRDVRGLGLMVDVELCTDDRQPDPMLTAAVQRNAVDEALLLLTCGTAQNVVRFIPPLVVDSGQIDDGVAALSRALDRVLDR